MSFAYAALSGFAGGPYASSTVPTKNLRVGAVGPDVQWVQERVTAWGFPVAVTGTFDLATDTAVRRFQERYAPPIDGIVGPITIAALKLQPAATATPPPVAASVPWYKRRVLGLPLWVLLTTASVGSVAFVAAKK